MIEGLRDPNQAVYYHGDLYNDAADLLARYSSHNDMSEFVDQLLEKVPDEQDYTELENLLDKIGDGEDVEEMMVAVGKAEERLSAILDKFEKAKAFMIERSQSDQ